MNVYPAWQYNEMTQVGVDFSDTKEIQTYDEKMQKFRDIRKENEEILGYINASKNHIVVEFGTGTGEFAVEASQHCSKIYAIDVSSSMIEFARKKAEMKGRENIEFHNAGFLTYEHIGEPVDVVVSQLALHHLPDFWKSIALRRIYKMLKLNGKFFLKDVVYSFDTDNYNDIFNNWVDKIKQVIGYGDTAETTIREEYATLGWVMEGLIKKAGFHIDDISYREDFIAVYMCKKTK